VELEKAELHNAAETYEANRANLQITAFERPENFDVPQLAKGGIVPARPGGTLVNVGEGGEAEAVVPLADGRHQRRD
jgi:hypothetical protein